MEAIETIDYKGHKLEIFQDLDYSETPNDWEGSNGDVFLVNFHTDFWVEDKRTNETDVSEWYQGEKHPLENEYWIFPVSALIHSGVTLSLSRSFSSDSGGWDTSHVGAIFVKKILASIEEKAFKVAEGTIETWNDILRGEIYGFSIDSGEGDSCWGFVGDIDDAIEAGKEAIDGIDEKQWQKYQAQKRIDALKQWEMSLPTKERKAIARSLKSVEKQLSNLLDN